MLGRASPLGEPISARANSFQDPGPRQTGQRASVNALMSYFAGTQNRLLLRKSENLACCAVTLRRFAYSHRYLYAYYRTMRHA